MKMINRYKEPDTLSLLRREMDNIFDDVMPIFWRRSDGRRLLDTWTPSSDIAENEKEYMLRIDLPGMEKKDIKVNYQDGGLTISGERKEEESEEGRDFLRKERYLGSFYRAFTLPEAIKEDQIKAVFKDGVLKVNVPKAEVKEPKSVKVE